MAVITPDRDGDRLLQAIQHATLCFDMKQRTQEVTTNTKPVKTISVRVDPNEHERLRHLAEASGRSLGGQLRFMARCAQRQLDPAALDMLSRDRGRT